MPKQRQRRRCRAHRSNGQPCSAWAITGGAVCWAHGGAAGQVRRDAAERVAMDAITREIASSTARLERERLEWWVERIVWLAGVLGEDPAALTREMRNPFVRGLWHSGALLPGGMRWPAGLGPADEPQLRRDGRFGPRVKT